MSNRQARREQSRAARTQRAATKRTPTRRSGGGGNRPGAPSWLAQPFTLLAIGLGLLLAVVLGVVLILGNDSKSDAAVTALEAARTNIPTEMASGHKLGNDSAPLKLTAFEDFQCPFCLDYTASQEPTLVEEYVKSGKMQITYQHFPALGRESVWAANASFCAADQNKFWEFHNVLFLSQAKAGQLEEEVLNSGRFDTEDLKAFAADAGVPDKAKFDACVDNLEHQAEIVDQERKARSVGITGTPGFLLNDRPLTTAGAISTLDGWRSVLDDEIERVENPTLVPVVQTSTPVSTTPPQTGTSTPGPTAPAATATP